MGPRCNKTSVESRDSAAAKRRLVYDVYCARGARRTGRAGRLDRSRLRVTDFDRVGHEHADTMIRRVMITAPFAYESHLLHLANQLDGLQLEPEDGAEGPVLDRLRSDPVALGYLNRPECGRALLPLSCRVMMITNRQRP